MKHFWGPCYPFLSELSIFTCHQLGKHIWPCLLFFDYFYEESV